MQIRQNTGKDNLADGKGGDDKKKEKKYHGKLLVLMIMCGILIGYYTYVFEIIWRNLTTSNMVLMAFLLIIFNLLIILLLWCFIITMNTQPGEIPLYWGFYIGDDDYKRKRYCLICNAFKPERSHHCSVCNVCVLNMDHHCPWVDNCIGFYNRKYFMQLLFYVCCLTIYIDISAAYFVYVIIRNMIKMRVGYKDIFHITIVLGVYFLVLVFSVIITNFFKFHLTLILTNSTTIESLDKEHKAENEKFNVSPWVNWIQVFGYSKCLWFLPFIVESGRPIGDGLEWQTKQIGNEMTNSLSNKENAPDTEMRNMPNANNYGSNNYNSNSPIMPNNA